MKSMLIAETVMLIFDGKGRYVRICDGMYKILSFLSKLGLKETMVDGSLAFMVDNYYRSQTTSFYKVPRKLKKPAKPKAKVKLASREQKAQWRSSATTAKYSKNTGVKTRKR